MQAIILKSNPETRFRFGEALGAYTEETHNAQKTTSEYLHSDTLWSALVNAWALACPVSLEKFLSACDEGKFKLSSAFYCVETPSLAGRDGVRSVFFLPKPASLNLFQSDEPKKLKRIKFISKGIWEQGIVPADWFDKAKYTLLQNETVVALKSEIADEISLFKTETMPHTRARDISDREDAFYYQTDLFLAENVSWYFILDNNLPDELQSDFQTALKMLVNLGIGGERTTGCGSLSEFIVNSWQLVVKDSEYQSSVSLIAPKENELTENSLYQVIKRGGRFLEKGKCLPMIQMLLEGAVFNSDIKGRIVTLNDNPPILRYGLNLSIPLHPNFLTSNF
jgi:CRISPR-associated protein Csm4